MLWVGTVRGCWTFTVRCALKRRMDEKVTVLMFTTRLTGEKTDKNHAPHHEARRKHGSRDALSRSSGPHKSAECLQVCPCLGCVRRVLGHELGDLPDEIGFLRAALTRLSPFIQNLFQVLHLQLLQVHCAQVHLFICGRRHRDKGRVLSKLNKVWDVTYIKRKNPMFTLLRHFQCTCQISPTISFEVRFYLLCFISNSMLIITMVLGQELGFFFFLLDKNVHDVEK